MLRILQRRVNGLKDMQATVEDMYIESGSDLVEAKFDELNDVEVWLEAMRQRRCPLRLFDSLEDATTPLRQSYVWLVLLEFSGCRICVCIGYFSCDVLSNMSPKPFKHAPPKSQRCPQHHKNNLPQASQQYPPNVSKTPPKSPKHIFVEGRVVWSEHDQNQMMNSFIVSFSVSLGANSKSSNYVLLRWLMLKHVVIYLTHLYQLFVPGVWRGRRPPPEKADKVIQRCFVCVVY